MLELNSIRYWCRKPLRSHTKCFLLMWFGKTHGTLMGQKSRCTVVQQPGWRWSKKRLHFYLSTCKLCWIVGECRGETCSWRHRQVASPQGSKPSNNTLHARSTTFVTRTLQWNNFILIAANWSVHRAASRGQQETGRAYALCKRRHLALSFDWCTAEEY